MRCSVVELELTFLLKTTKNCNKWFKSLRTDEKKFCKKRGFDRGGLRMRIFGLIIRNVGNVSRSGNEIFTLKNSTQFRTSTMKIMNSKQSTKWLIVNNQKQSEFNSNLLSNQKRLFNTERKNDDDRRARYSNNKNKNDIEIDESNSIQNTKDNNNQLKNQSNDNHHDNQVDFTKKYSLWTRISALFFEPDKERRLSKDPVLDPIQDDVILEQKDKLDLYWIYSLDFYEEPLNRESSDSIATASWLKKLAYRLAALLAFASLGYGIYIASRQFFSPLGAQRMFSSSLSVVKNDAKVIQMLGEPIKAYGNFELVLNPFKTELSMRLSPVVANDEGFPMREVQYHISGPKAVALVSAVCSTPNKNFSPFAPLTFERITVDVKMAGARNTEVKTIRLA